ncbi:fasciclin domain-containing protein [Dokdonia sp. PRO95]|uniref:fasciclin domain-containing protein n=1 Tax=Dokdonia sp. PRO95 TaxID=1239415 RepID=UPI00055251BD|nr:fasciclin domain-containing protein [Dokdonia sp. PRO95]
MKNLISITKLAFIALTLLVTVSCNDDDDNGNIIEGESNTIADFVAGNENYSSLLAALQRTNLDATLAGSGTFTVFAPDNAAFETFLNGAALEDVDDAVLTQVLLNHVLNTTVTSSELSTGYVSNLATEPSSNANISLYVDTTDGVVLNGQSTVTTADIVTDNGVIHAVDTVIDLPTVVTFATTNPALTSLVAALTDEGNTTFTDLLSDTEADFTVFAPTNDAFGTFLGDNTLEDVDNEALAQVLSNHVVPGAVAISSTLSNAYVNTAATFEGNDDAPISLYVNTDNGVSLNGSSNVIIADIVTVNGVIHVVDTVIGLPDITTFATADPNFSTLVAALTADESFGYVAALQTPFGTSPAPFTVFAPTNDAFGDLLADLELEMLSDIPTETLAATLELHVIPNSNVRAEDLADLDGTAVTPLGGADVTIQADPAAVIDPDGDANPIVATNVQATNGVIHAVSRVLRDL